jgi:hypothetical protein
MKIFLVHSRLCICVKLLAKLNKKSIAFLQEVNINIYTVPPLKNTFKLLWIPKHVFLKSAKYVFQSLRMFFDVLECQTFIFIGRTGTWVEIRWLGM